jgi:protein SCO1/2
MNRRQLIRYWAWGAAALFLMMAAVLTWSSTRDDAATETADATAQTGVQVLGAGPFGGSFTLVSDTGEPVTEATLRGHPTLMFFGFTNCPDVCPTALAEASAWLDELGDEAANLSVYFVTVDPERDTELRLAQYLSAFDPDIIGLTGAPDAVHAMLDAFHVFYQRVPLDSQGYTMDHYASFYLLDDTGDLAGLIAYNEERQAAIAKIRRVIARSL